MTILELYKKYGIVDVNDYTTPNTGYLKDFPTPKDSLYVYLGKYTDVIPPEKEWLVSDINKSITVYTPDRFNHLVGKASKNSNLRSVLKPYIRNTEKFNFVHNISRLDNVSKALPVVVSYAHIEKIYKRSNYLGKDLDVVGSVVGSAVSDLVKGLSTRSTFIDIELPNKLEGINEYVNLLKKGKNYYAKYYNKFEDFVFFEIIKFIMFKERDASMFKPLMELEDKRGNYFILRSNGRFTIISIHDLLAFDNSNVDGKLSKNGKDSLKAFIKYVLSFLVNSKEGIDDKDLDAKLSELKDVVVVPNIKNKKIASHVKSKDIALDEVEANVRKGILDTDRAEKLKVIIKDSKRLDSTRESKDFVLTKDDMKLSSSLLTDDAALNDPIGARDRMYLEKHYEEDTKRMFEHFNSSGIIAVESHDITEVNNKINSITTHTLSIMQSNGRTKKIIRHVPKPDKDGKLRLNNNESVLMKQKSDIPIRKIDATRVSLTSYFGKLMLTRGYFAKDNISKGIFKQLKELNEEGKIKLLVESSNTFNNVELPYWYTRTAHTVLSFVLGNMFFTFNYDVRSKYIDNLKEVEKHGVFIGKQGNTPIVIKGDELFLVKEKPVLLGKFLDVIGLNLDKLPLEQSVIALRGKRVPLILPLLNYIPFRELLEDLNIKYTEFTSVRESNKEDNEYIVAFKDRVFKFDRRDVKSTMLLSGLVSIRKELKYYSVEDISTIQGFQELYSMLGYNKGDINELSLLKTLFVDPLTADVLKLMGEPTSFPKLLIRANELLVLDDYKSMNHIEGTMLKSYERLNGMVYHSMVKELRVYKNGLGMTNASIVTDPYAVMRILNEDGSTELLEDINPIAALKQRENITLLGFLGRDKASIPLKARELDVTEVGIISEASKESSAVGITAYLSSSPNIDNTIGLNKSPEKLTPYNISSTSSNLLPFSERDDGKRKLFNSVQAGHVIALKNQSVLPLLTGYEGVFAQRVDDKFVTTAEDDGVVLSLSPKKLTIKYKKNGTKSYNIKTWFSKEMAGETFRHVMKANVVKDSLVKKGDTLLYDTLFFGPNVFDKQKVLYKTGMLVRLAFFEDTTNYEDSAGISKRYSEEASANIVLVKANRIDTDSSLIDFREIGEKVTYTTPLFINRSIDVLKDKPVNIKGKTLDILKDLVSDIPKAEVNGTIEDIVVYYRAELKDFSGALRKFIQASDDRLMEKFGYTGLVDHTYSSEGVPLDITEIEIKYYIEYSLDMTHRDKGVIQNQIKFTVGDVFDKITDEDGKEIDITMSNTSIDARVVDSAYTAITTTTLMIGITDGVNKLSGKTPTI